jgi:hypothetical protein
MKSGQTVLNLRPLALEALQLLGDQHRLILEVSKFLKSGLPTSAQVVQSGLTLGVAGDPGPKLILLGLKPGRLFGPDLLNGGLLLLGGLKPSLRLLEKASKAEKSVHLPDRRSIPSDETRKPYPGTLCRDAPRDPARRPYGEAAKGFDDPSRQAVRLKGGLPGRAVRHRSR